MSVFHDVVESLAMHAGVRGAVVAAADGVVVDGVVHVDVRADALAAFGTAVLSSATALGTATLALPRCVVIDAESGRLFLTGNNELAIIVLTDRRASLGRLRLALQQALEALS